MSTEKARKGSKTTHAVAVGYLGQLDLPVRPGFLRAVRTVEANVPRITQDWLIRHGPVTFDVVLPPDLQPGTVVEWEDLRGGTWRDWAYTVVAAISPTSVTFRHAGRGPDGALAAARMGNDLRRAA